MKTISFKLPQKEMKILKKLAMERSKTIDQYAKQVMIQYLNGKLQEEKIEEVFKEIYNEISVQRELLISVVERMEKELEKFEKVRKILLILVKFFKEISEISKECRNVLEKKEIKEVKEK